MRTFSLVLVVGLACQALPVLAQNSSAQGLTLERALQMARENNGTVRAALLNYEASRANSRSAFAAYFPALTPSFEYQTTRDDVYTGFSRGLLNDTASTSALTASWLVLDAGVRDATYRRSAIFRNISEQSALQTLREVLFSVHSTFYETLRADELLKVRQSELDRALEIEKQTKEFAETGAGAKKDILQATADALNAKASLLTARNGASTSRANLKAVLGVPEREGLEAVVAPQQDEIQAVDYTLEDALREGLKSRPDLQAQRYQVDAQRQSVRLAQIDHGLTWTLDAVHTHAFSPDPFDHSALVFQISIPLYDGSRSGENLRSNRLGLEAERASLTQLERDASAEVESAYKEFAQNQERLTASKAALEASQLNYKAAFEARAQGAGELIQLLTAQVSLTTAESNYIEAYYDTLISRVRLSLVTGRPLPGEKP